jgi:hypothetical protein
MINLSTISRQITNPYSTVSNSDLITICDNDCLQEQQLANLKNIYLESKNTMDTAPIQYEIAKKNYFTMKDGVNGYNEMLKEEYINEGNAQLLIIENNFIQNYNKVYEKIQMLQELQQYAPSPTTTEGFEGISDSSIQLTFEGIPDSSIQLTLPQQGIVASNLNNDIILNNRKSQYELEEYNKLRGYYNIYFIVFYILVCVLLLMFIKTTPISYFTKFIIILCLALYPYYISWLVYFIYNGLTFIYNRTTLNIFRKI